MVLFWVFFTPYKGSSLPKHYKSASGAVTVQLYFQALLKQLAVRAFNLTKQNKKKTDKNINLHMISVTKLAIFFFFWGAGTHHFVWFSKERRVGWEGFVTLLNFLISPFPFFHTQHIPVFTVHVATSKKISPDHRGKQEGWQGPGEGWEGPKEGSKCLQASCGPFWPRNDLCSEASEGHNSSNLPNSSPLPRAVTPIPQLPSNRETFCSNKKNYTEKYPPSPQASNYFKPLHPLGSSRFSPRQTSPIHFSNPFSPPDVLPPPTHSVPDFSCRLGLFLVLTYLFLAPILQHILTSSFDVVSRSLSLPDSQKAFQLKAVISGQFWQ